MTIEAELHDGRVLEFPDGTPPEVVQATVKKMLGPQQPPIPAAVNLNPAVGYAEGLASLGSGAAGAIAGGISGLFGSATPGPQGQGADRVQQIIDALRYDPKTAAGQTAARTMSAIPEAIGGLADKAGGALTSLVSGGSDEFGNKLPPEAAAALGTAANVGVQAIPAAIGRMIPKVAAPLAAKPNPSLSVVPKGAAVLPEEAKAGIVTRNIASVADETKLAKDISRKNNPILAEKIASDLNMPKGTELDTANIKTARKDAYKPFEAARKLGEVTTDEKYAAEADAVANQYRSASRSFPKMAKEDVQKIVDGIKVDKFDASDAVDMAKTLREDADAAFVKGDKRIGFANKRAADAIENMIERHAQKVGQPNLVKDIRQARVTIAKTYAAEKALGPQGTINPQVYARELRKNPDMLTGGAKEVAEFARDFPRSTLKPSTTPTGMGAMDVLAGMFTKEGLLPLARPIARSVLASDPYQSAFVKNPGALARILSSPEAGRSLAAAGAGGAAGKRTLKEIIRDASR